MYPHGCPLVIIDSRAAALSSANLLRAPAFAPEGMVALEAGGWRDHRRSGPSRGVRNAFSRRCEPRRIVLPRDSNDDYRVSSFRCRGKGVPPRARLRPRLSRHASLFLEDTGSWPTSAGRGWMQSVGDSRKISLASGKAGSATPVRAIRSCSFERAGTPRSGGGTAFHRGTFSSCPESGAALSGLPSDSTMLELSCPAMRKVPGRSAAVGQRAGRRSHRWRPSFCGERLALIVPAGAGIRADGDA